MYSEETSGWLVGGGGDPGRGGATWVRWRLVWLVLSGSESLRGGRSCLVVMVVVVVVVVFVVVVVLVALDHRNHEARAAGGSGRLLSL